MLLDKRIKRAFQHLREKRLEREAHQDESLPIEKGDMAAMIISALIVIVPIALLVLLLMVGIPWLLTR